MTVYASNTAESIHNLETGQTDLTAVVDTNTTNISTNATDIANLDTRVTTLEDGGGGGGGNNWAGPWLEGATYSLGSVVRDGPWLVVATVETTGTDRPGPQLSGPLDQDMPVSPSFLTQAVTAGHVVSGNTYTFSRSGWVKTFRVWPIDVSGTITHKLLALHWLDTGEVVVRELAAPTSLIAGQWNDIDVGRFLVRTGDKWTFALESMDSSGDTPISGDWTRVTDTDTIDPGTGNYAFNVFRDAISISYTDDAAADRTADIQSIVPGSNIEIETANELYNLRIIYAENDYPTYTLFSLACPNGYIGEAGLPAFGHPPATITVNIPTRASINYGVIVNHWAGGWPSWASIAGFLLTNGAFQSVANEAFCVAVEFQPAYISPEWDIQAHSGEFV